MPAIYVDTSALAKRYIGEIDAERFEDFVGEHVGALQISPLVVTEFHSSLMRRRRMGEVDEQFVGRARDAFAADIAASLWSWNPFPVAAFGDASLLIQDPTLSLATLDALHLACARLLDCDQIATADRRLAQAARQRGLHTHQFAD